MAWDDIWDEAASVPFWGTLDEAEKLADLIRRCVAVVTESASPREMVLESWLVVDYAIRDLLVSGYWLTGFCEDDFDVRYELLPKSFWGLLKLLQRTISHQKGLGPEASISDDYPPYVRFSSVGFLRYLAGRYPDVRGRLKEIEREYFADLHPELAKEIEQGRELLVVDREKTANRVPSGWIEVAGGLGEDWCAAARRLNDARNKAAHSYDSAAIARAFGIQGPKAVDRVRDECLKLLKKLLGIALAADDSDSSEENA